MLVNNALGISRDSMPDHRRLRFPRKHNRGGFRARLKTISSAREVLAMATSGVHRQTQRGKFPE
jgi:hypothetical protein